MTRRDADRERFPKLREDLGEDPAHYLDQPLFSGDDGTSDPIMMIRGRVRGIDKLAAVNAWLAIERRLDRGPREPVMGLLEDRREYLEAHGERTPSGMTRGERRERARELFEATEGRKATSRDGEEGSVSASQKLARMRSDQGETA